MILAYIYATNITPKNKGIIMNSIKQTIDKLWSVLINYEWFADKIIENPSLHKSLIAYVDRMDIEVLTSVPDQIDDYEVRVHFIGSIDEKYAASLPSNKSFNSLLKLPDFTSSEIIEA